MKPDPRYPDEAAVVQIERSDLGPFLSTRVAEGRVRVRVLVRADGTVGGVEILESSGYPSLDRAASEAITRWRFAPATRDGQPIDAYYVLTVRFVVI